MLIFSAPKMKYLWKNAWGRIFFGKKQFDAIAIRVPEYFYIRVYNNFETNPST